MITEMILIHVSGTSTREKVQVSIKTILYRISSSYICPRQRAAGLELWQGGNSIHYRKEAIENIIERRQLKTFIKEQHFIAQWKFDRNDHG